MVPVGALSTPTTSGEAVGNGAPSEPRYSVLTSVPLSDTHHGVVGPEVRPQALTRFESVLSAEVGWSETSLVTLNEVLGAAVSGLTATMATPRTNASTSSARRPCEEMCSPIITLLWPETISLVLLPAGPRSGFQAEPEVGFEP